MKKWVSWNWDWLFKNAYERHLEKEIERLKEELESKTRSEKKMYDQWFSMRAKLINIAKELDGTIDGHK